MHPIVRELVFAAKLVAGNAGAYVLNRGMEVMLEEYVRRNQGKVALMRKLRFASKLGTAAFAALSLGLVVMRLVKRRRFVFLDHPIVAESIVRGSEEIPVRPPSCQIWLAYPNQTGDLEVVGSGMRVQLNGCSYVMTAAHNVAFDDDLFIIKGANVHRYGRPEAIIVGVDAALLPVNNSVWSTLSVGVASFAPVPTRLQTAVNVCGRDCKGTSGFLTTAPNLIGAVSYSATTKGGYSGAPYFSGKTIFGMHTHGGVRNGGYSAMYLLAMCHLALDPKHQSADQESLYTFGWYKRMYGKSRENPAVQFLEDRAIVMNDDGHAYVLTKEQFADYNRRMAVEAGEEAYADHEEEDEEEYGPEDYECAQRSLNSKGPGKSRASSSSAPLQELEEAQNQLSSILEESKLVRKQLREDLRYSKFVLGKPRTTSSQTSPKAPSSAPSKSTQKGGKKQ